MTKPFRAFAIGAGFAVVSLLGIGLWASWRRAQLRDPMRADGHSDAVAVLEFVEGRDPGALRHDLFLRSRLEELVEARGMVGVIVVDADGKVIARAGELEPPVMDAALDDVSAKPGTREVGEKMLYREARGGVIAVAIEDRRPVDAAWKPVRNSGLIAALVAMALSPLIGIYFSRLKKS
jgi:hypothetical protein